MGNGPWPSLNIVKQSTMSKLMNSSDVCLAQQDHFLLHSSCSVFTPRHCSAALGQDHRRWRLELGIVDWAGSLYKLDTVHTSVYLRYSQMDTLGDFATFRLICLRICHSSCHFFKQ